ncbi:laccase domain protein [Alphaproteobacteria bacterium]|nr:laccase domain protein [Alphaproteobacteria bacterium]GHS95951.1 laccase domain protein [Alphaproteobacteria bacterium]
MKHYKKTHQPQEDYFSVPLWEKFEKEGLFHGFFKKKFSAQGTKGAAQELGQAELANVAFARGDSDEGVMLHRQRVAAYAKGAECIFFTEQAHTDRVRVVPSPPWEGPCDALVTNCPHVLLGIYTADCVPVLLYDPVAKVIGAAHCGWKGLQQNLLTKTVETMQTLGAHAADIQGALGPCIHQEFYSVADDFCDNFPDDHDCFVKKEGLWFGDLPGIVKKQGKKLGLACLSDLNIDTYEHPELFFSYRRALEAHQATTRSQASVIMMRA